MTISDILASTPNWFGNGASPIPDDFDKQSEQVRDAVASIRWQPGNLEALRLLALAHYVGALSESDIAQRLTGDNQALAGDVLALPSGANTTSDESMDQIINADLNGYPDRRIRSANIDEGWLATVLELLIEVRPAAVELVLARDWPTSFTLRWLLHRWLTPEQSQRFASVLMVAIDARKWRAAAALLAGVARSAVLNDTVVPEFDGSNAAVLVVAGLVLSQLARMRLENRVRANIDAAMRFENLTESIASTVASKINSESDAASLERARTGDEAALLGILLGTVGSTTSTLSARGKAVLNEFFRELKGAGVILDDEGLPYLSAPVLPDLVTIWKQIGGDSTLFRELEARLHFDEYAYQFAFGHYLTDRRRAICLAALGAEGGTLQSDDLLLAESRDLAARLHALPPGAVQVFDDVTIARLAAMNVVPPTS